jgi:hypothetical protein
VKIHEIGDCPSFDALTGRVLGEVTTRKRIRGVPRVGSPEEAVPKLWFRE